MVGRRLSQILLGALELGVDDISRAILVTGIDVKMPLFASWLRRGQPITFVGAVRSAEIAQLILDLGADVNEPSSNLYDGCYYAPIYHALLGGDTALADTFLGYSATFDPNFHPRDRFTNTTIRGKAIQRRDKRLIRWLLARGAQCKDFVQHIGVFRGRTDLQQAIAAGDTEILSALFPMNLPKTYSDQGFTGPPHYMKPLPVEE
ncbi:MAG: hypothetical protein CL912_21815 [Deltaproteobacteria bacterium]|nr:hypothetical protein [Deltaproteobacteria bacterium]